MAQRLLLGRGCWQQFAARPAPSQGRVLAVPCCAAHRIAPPSSGHRLIANDTGSKSAAATTGWRRPNLAAHCQHLHSAARRPAASSSSISKHRQGSSARTASRRALHVARTCLETERIICATPPTALTAPRRLRVAVDVDEVLGRFVYALNQFCAAQYSMQHTVSDYWIYEFAKIWGVDQDKSNHIVHEFFKSHHFLEGIPVIPGAFEALTRLADSCDLVVVTSRQHVIQDQTLDWIDTHFPGVFQEVYFGNHWSLEGVSRKKSDICAAIGATVLIDDNPAYATECAAAGINVLLYDWNAAYPWSKLKPGQQHSLIRVVRDWAEVERQVLALAQQPAHVLGNEGHSASA